MKSKSRNKLLNLVRFGVSLEGKLFENFNKLISKQGYTSRSEAIRDLIRERLVEEEWGKGGIIVGAICLVYNHSRRELIDKITDTQHRFHENVISTQHIHLDKKNCLEIVAVKGNSKQIKELWGRLKSIRGVKHTSLALSTLGKNIE
jgi:CopG family nickel-responsive transcriptional regulator